MATSYSKRYFDGHVFKRQSVVTPASINRSNSMYDNNKGLTHTFLHTNKGSKDDSVRLIGDVEICMSQDLAVTSEFSPIYRNNLRNGLISAKGDGPTGLNDDELLNSVPCNVKLEREEAVEVAKNNIDSVNQQKRLFYEKAKETSNETPPESSPSSTPSSSEN